jgi:hypothetical protein
MDGMVRAHKSEGVHDPIFARMLVLANDKDLKDACVFVSVEVCAIERKDAAVIKQAIQKKTGIPANNIIVAATHTHSGPATVGYFNPIETEYLNDICTRIPQAIAEAVANLKPAAAGCGSGAEFTVGYYRRLLADNGQVVMNWIPYPPEHLVGPLGDADNEVGVMKVVEAANPKKVICIVYNYASHPNVLSGDSYVISGDYSGFASKTLEDKFGGVAIYLNGAQGSMDIDGLRDRDWEGVVRCGTALANAVSDTLAKIQPDAATTVNCFNAQYNIPKRRITRDELAWCDKVLAAVGDTVQAMADGVGDDSTARLLKGIHAGPEDVPIEQVCCVVGDTAFISFCGEAFVEIGQAIKAGSPFKHTYFVGLANGKAGYLPTKKAIGEGGYAVSVRTMCDDGADTVVNFSLALLRKAYQQTIGKY